MASLNRPAAAAAPAELSSGLDRWKCCSCRSCRLQSPSVGLPGPLQDLLHRNAGLGMLRWRDASHMLVCGPHCLNVVGTLSRRKKTSEGEAVSQTLVHFLPESTNGKTAAGDCSSAAHCTLRPVLKREQDEKRRKGAPPCWAISIPRYSEDLWTTFQDKWDRDDQIMCRCT